MTTDCEPGGSNWPLARDFHAANVSGSGSIRGGLTAHGERQSEEGAEAEGGHHRIRSLFLFPSARARVPSGFSIRDDDADVFVFDRSSDRRGKKQH